MSKKITHEQARQHLEDKIKDGNILTVLEYIKQQEELEKEYNTCVKHLKLVELHSNSKDEIIEKQQKLSELYKELATLYRDRFDYNNSATEIKRLWGKIKVLENER